MSDVPAKVHDLVATFARNAEEYRNPAFKEAMVRQQFVDPLFKCLGWDMDNEQGNAEAYKEVIHEASLKIGGQTKAPDYCFRIGTTPKFYLEAKKPAVNIKDDPVPAYQLRRYGWTRKLPVSILTDFEEFAVYDCRVKPSDNDKASTARIMYFRYEDYPKEWANLRGLFSLDAIKKGSFDKYAEGTKGKRGTATVDAAFLAEIESWRLELAKNIALRNPKIESRELNYAVQMTIDRILFLRMCEDRGIEADNQLRDLADDDGLYAELCKLFRKADQRYNSGLFHFEDENDRPEKYDALTPTLKMDDKVLKPILKNLYYPKCPYEFSVFPADILGQVYEQFLGKVIRLTTGHVAKVEEKPEVKKAGGVYYTPTYIVDYIVKNTVGKLLDGKTPKQAAKITVLDPACGSGSFLLGAYDYLLKWHLDYYTANDPKSFRKEVFDAQGGWRLTTAERKRILVNNIYGVDIDTQAVEVTKLSLLLKVLEGESQETLNTQLTFTKERALPDLANNIKCGNSLIGPDFYVGQQGLLFDDEEKYRINVFDWNKGFPAIMKAGGFDAVIGNPPWGSFVTNPEIVYLSKFYTNKKGEAETHLYFIEKGCMLLQHTGTLGFITPNTWLSVLNSQQIRKHLLTNHSINEIVELTKNIFRDAPDIVPIIISISKLHSSVNACSVKRTQHLRIDADNFAQVLHAYSIEQSLWTFTNRNVINLRMEKDTTAIIKKCNAAGSKIGDYCKFYYGIKTGNNEKYLSDHHTREHTVKALKTGNLRRYNIIWKSLYLNWCDELAGYRKARVDVPKIVVQYIRKISMNRRIIAAYDQNGTYFPLNNYSYCLPKPDIKIAHEYVIGILNSSLINYYFANTYIDYNIKPTYLQQLPFVMPNNASKASCKTQVAVIANVKRMMSYQDKLNTRATPHEKTALQAQIDATDAAIDALVYELYGLTAEEIAIVEAATAR